MTIKKLIVGATVSAAVLAGGAGAASAHPNSASGKAIGGPLVTDVAEPGTPGKGQGAMGHWRGIDCHAAVNSPVIGGPLGICVKD
jgi:hypothetical protein